MKPTFPKPNIGDYVKIIPGGTSSSGKFHVGEIVKVIRVEELKHSKFKWYIGSDIPNCEGLWPDEFIIVSNISKSQKQHLLDLIKSI